MAYARERSEFTPPPAPGITGALILAFLAHAVLVLALSLGVQWRSKITPTTVEAELWSALPQIAAPTPTPVRAPEPVPAPVPEPEPEPEPPAPKPAKPANVPPAPNPQIVQEKLRIEKEKLAELELAKQEKIRKENELKAKELQKKELKEKIAKEKPKSDTLTAAQTAQAAKAEARKLEEFRQQNLKRMAGMTGAAAAQTSGPSTEYAGRIRARIKPNITYTDTITGNPTAEVEVRTLPDGTIISRKISKSSGVTSWDEAVLAAIDKTEVLPRDVDGRVPSALVISFRPRD